MTKVTLTSILSGLYSRASLQSNFDKIQSQFNDKVLYRDNPTGEPNSMSNELDMDENKIVNLGTPTANFDAATKKYVDDVATGAQVLTPNGTFSSITVDTVTETTTDNGVVIEGSTLKDNDITTTDITAANVTTTTAVITDTISERSTGSGVTIDGVLLKDSAFTADSISVDTVAEKTLNNGVDIDGVLMKDDTVRIGDGGHEASDDLSISTESTARIGMLRVSEDANDPDIQLRKSRGTTGAKTVVQANDKVGTINFQGFDATNFHNYGYITTEVVNATLGNESGRMYLGVSRAGSLTALVSLAGGGTTPALRPVTGQTVNLGDGTSSWNDIQSATISMADGSAATPSYTFADDTSKDTGFYRVAENTIGFSTSGVLSGTINGSQRMLWGADNEDLTTGNSLNAAVQVTGTTGSKAALGINKFASDATPPNLLFMKSRAGTVGSLSACNVGDQIGKIIFSFDDGTNYERYGAALKSEVAGGGLVSNIIVESGGNVERFEFDENGNLLPIQASNTQDLGANLAANAWENIYSQNTLTVVSDTSYKAEQTDLDLAERRAFLECAQNVKKYKRIKPATVREEMDDNGRPSYVDMTLEERTESEWSVGVIAQEVVSIFQKHGLNAFEYRVVREMQDGKLMVAYDHLQCGALNAIAHGTTLV